MNERIKAIFQEAYSHFNKNGTYFTQELLAQKFAELIVRECIDKIETYRIPVGNSAAGEMACEWTYEALKEIRDDIKQHLGVEE